MRWHEDCGALVVRVTRSRVAALYDALQADGTKAEVARTIRALVDQVTLAPEDGELTIVLRGYLAAMLAHAANEKPGTIAGAGPAALMAQSSLVAGARNQRYLQALTSRIPRCNRLSGGNRSSNLLRDAN
jgi:site-specific DNA recombinase